MTEYITGRSNPLMTHIRKLVSSRAYRREQGEYVGDGVKLLEEAVKWNVPLSAVVYTRGTALPPVDDAVRMVEVPEDLMRSISPMETPQGALFVARMGGNTLPQVLPGRRYLAMEGVQDPGNVGTILRTADAYEADGVILLEGCADLYNPKTVRSTMGALFRVNAWSTTLSELRDVLHRSGLPLLGAALREDTVDAREADLRHAVILIGSEGKGLSEVALDACDKTIRIPMSARCESLNAAIAASTLLWEGYR
ncbi:MAG: RNA methyltransferase [Oscillospiraceae bacterium]|nr:RNA methyltransferase [Oscillospiraceae bacterium]